MGHPLDREGCKRWAAPSRVRAICLERTALRPVLSVSKEMASLLDNLLHELGYPQSSFYREGVLGADPAVAHLLRDAQRAGVRGSYFIRTIGGHIGSARERPAIHVAEASTADEAREIHRHLWNQGTTPFLLVSMPGQVRVYTGFAYDQANDNIGQVESPIDTASLSIAEVAERLRFLQADSIDSGEIWRTRGQYLTKERRVDRSLLVTLRSLSRHLVRHHHLDREVAHALIGRFVYLHYLRERDILSDQWLHEVDVEPERVFSGNATLNAFRRVTDAVDERFNGRIFPINWSSSFAPNADAVRATARAFRGEKPGSEQMALFQMFDFSFIPIELLSGIYEQFLHDEGKGTNEGAFYTSEPVADYVIAEIESVNRLRPNIRILDPSCGSGIFLVLTYRRLIEQELRARKTRTMVPEDLSRILTSSIFGVERNSEACLVAEFNLILTLLDYVQPPELHEHKDFRFPDLHNRQIFECDFFEDHTVFCKNAGRFDWIVGNVPWVELDSDDENERPALEWIRKARLSRRTPIARYRTSEAFTWRVTESLTENGVIGLITQATSLTNDQSADYRKAFFSQNDVHRITNFSNLAYVLFESAEEPAASIVYSPRKGRPSSDEIIHFGPLVANQLATAPTGTRRRRVPWVLTICESDIQAVPAAEAARGEATTWKCALWGNPRDRRAFERMKQVLPATLEDLVSARGWHLNLGLQLRKNRGTESEPNQSVSQLKRDQGMEESKAREFSRWFDSLKVMDPKHPRKAKQRLTVQDSWIVPNQWGSFLRQGRDAGLDIIRAPHIFLWNDFAAFGEQDFIFRHPKLGLSAPSADSDWLRAVSVIWTSSITSYCLFLNLSAGWGISRSTIDLGDARQVPMPVLTDELVAALASLHRQFAAEEVSLSDHVDWQRRLDQEIASILKMPSQAMLLAREFKEFRLPLVKGKAPSRVMEAPDQPQLESYAERLAGELDAFLERKGGHHVVSVMSADVGVVATIELVAKTQQTLPVVAVRKAGPNDQNHVLDILRAAQQKYGQWIYVRRSVRVFAGKKIHICKPAYSLEWTESRALLDAADVIAEVAEACSRSA